MVLLLKAKSRALLVQCVCVCANTQHVVAVFHFQIYLFVFFRGQNNDCMFVLQFNFSFHIFIYSLSCHLRKWHLELSAHTHWIEMALNFIKNSIREKKKKKYNLNFTQILSETVNKAILQVTSFHALLTQTTLITFQRRKNKNEV